MRWLWKAWWSFWELERWDQVSLVGSGLEEESESESEVAEGCGGGGGGVEGEDGVFACVPDQETTCLS